VRYLVFMTPTDAQKFLQRQGHTTTLDVVENQIVVIEGRVGSMILLLTFFLTNPSQTDHFLGFTFTTHVADGSEPSLEAINAMNKENTFFKAYHENGGITVAAEHLVPSEYLTEPLFANLFRTWMKMQRALAA
jgi:hypothetical protein